MAVATLSRNGNSIELPLLGEDSGELLIGVDHGKPEAGGAALGGLDPIWGDFQSQMQTYTLGVRFTDSSAYNDAIDLADMIKSHSQGNNLILDLPVDEYDSNIPVAPAAGQSEAVNFAYNPGTTDYVDAELGLTRVENIFAASNPPSNHVVDTTPVSGSGPITLSNGSKTVEFNAGVSVERSVGRPNSSVDSKYKQWPDYQDNIQAAYDAFEFGFQIVDNAVSDTGDLIEMVTTRMGRSALTLDFNGIFNLGSYDVAPDGSGALRTARLSGRTEWTESPRLTLRVIEGR